MGMTGSSVSNPNRRLHFFGIVFIGILAFGSVLYWRQKSLVAAEYTDFPKHEKKADKAQLRSKNFQIDTEDI